MRTTARRSTRSIARNALRDLDNLGLAVPNGFQWPTPMRRAFGRARAKLQRLAGVVLVAILALATVACGSKGVVREDVADGKVVTRTIEGVDANYAAYLDAHDRARSESAGAIASIAGAAESCTDSRCAEHVAAMAALAAAGGAGRTPGPSPYVKPPTFLDRLFGLAQATLPAAINGAVSWRQSDNAVRMRESDNAAQTALYAGAFGLGSTAITNAGDRYTVGGNLGDTYGDNYTGRDRTDIAADNGAVIGDSNQVANGDDNRFYSPGPIDNSNDGDECTGEGCQPSLPPDDGGGG